jgi:hypothetical protein
MFPTIRKIGSYFRKKIGVDLAGPHPCGMCREATHRDRREWSSNLQSYVDIECIPAIVRRRGPSAVRYWLDSGLLLEGTREEQSRVILQTELYPRIDRQ